MTENTRANAELAAALFCTVGGGVPHTQVMLEKAAVLAKELNSRDALLQKMAELCAPASTPQQWYLTLKAYSWLGAHWAKQAIEAAESYLAGPPWDALPVKQVLENGIIIDQGMAGRASVLRDLAKAQQGLSYLARAQDSYAEAYRLEPHNAMNAIKVAEVIARADGKPRALAYLRGERKSSFFTPIKYTDTAGIVRCNDTFKQLLNAHILKLEER